MNIKYPNLKNILCNKHSYPFDLISFIQFSKYNYSDENIFLWLNIKNYENANNNILYLKSIYDIYIKENSNMEVNISFQNKKYIKKYIYNIENNNNDSKLLKTDKYIFLNVKLELYHIILINIYIPFIENIKKKKLICDVKNYSKNLIQNKIHNIILITTFLIKILFYELLFFYRFIFF